jgi:hypothetical protein
MADPRIPTLQQVLAAQEVCRFAKSVHDKIESDVPVEYQDITLIYKLNALEDVLRGPTPSWISKEKAEYLTHFRARIEEIEQGFE